MLHDLAMKAAHDEENIEIYLQVTVKYLPWYLVRIYNIIINFIIIHLKRYRASHMFSNYIIILCLLSIMSFSRGYAIECY